MSYIFSSDQSAVQQQQLHDALQRHSLDHNQRQATNQGINSSLQQVPLLNRYVVTEPSTLQGSRCYFNASLLPDNIHTNPRQAGWCYFNASLLPNNIYTNPRQAGLGIFILNLLATPTQYIHIQARLWMCTSVLMAKSAALALVALIVSTLNITKCLFLSDCEQLVSFINSLDHSNPSDLPFHLGLR